MNDDNAASVSLRPYRLYDSGTKTYLRWRNYLILENARIGAWVEAKYMPIGTAIQLINIETAQLLGEYKRIVKGVEITFEADEFYGARKLRRVA